MEQKIVDIGAFQADVGLDHDTLKELYLVFVDEIKQANEAVSMYLSMGKIQELTKTIHNIKGIASSYKARNVFDHAKNLDVKLKYGDFDNIIGYVADLSKVIDEAIKVITEYFADERSS